MRPFLSVVLPSAAAAVAAAGVSALLLQRQPGDAAARPAAAAAVASVLPQRGQVAAERPQQFALADAAGPRHAFYFTRGIYTDRGRWGWRGSWAIDFPKADQQFLTVLRRLTNIDAYASENAVALTDPELRRFPFLYMLEVGYMDLTPAEVRGLRDYVLAGGFVFIDDFWGSEEWYNFEQQMQRVLPEYRIVDLPLDHPIFSSFYQIREILQVPAIGNIRRGRTSERDGIVPAVRGIFNDDGRLLVMINWNTDIGDAWEWAEQPDYPLKYSTYAYQMGVNAIVYAMSR